MAKGPCLGVCLNSGEVQAAFYSVKPPLHGDSSATHSRDRLQHARSLNTAVGLPIMVPSTNWSSVTHAALNSTTRSLHVRQRIIRNLDVLIRQVHTSLRRQASLLTTATAFNGSPYYEPQHWFSLSAPFVWSSLSDEFTFMQLLIKLWILPVNFILKICFFFWRHVTRETPIAEARENTWRHLPLRLNYSQGGQILFNLNYWNVFTITTHWSFVSILT